MKRPILNEEERQTITTDSFSSDILKLYLAKLGIKREIDKYIKKILHPIYDYILKIKHNKDI